MNKPVQIIMIGEAEKAYKFLNMIVGQQLAENKTSTEEMQLLKSIKQKVDFIKSKKRCATMG